MTEITEAVERATRPIVGMHNRTAQEVFDIMCDRVRFALQAAREEASQGAGEPVADDVAVYNKRFDAADEAGQEIHAEAFWQGWMWARDPNFEDEEGMREEFNRGIDGVVLGEAWEACREAFFKRLPLAALDQPTSPPTDPRIKALEEALRPFASLDVPAKPQGNAGAYSIRHADILRARAALTPSDQAVKGDEHG